MKLYHRTCPKNKENILKKGLLTRFSNFWKDSGGLIYLSNIENTGFGEVIFEILEVPDINKLTQISEWEMVYHGDIPIQMISVLER